MSDKAKAEKLNLQQSVSDRTPEPTTGAGVVFSAGDPTVGFNFQVDDLVRRVLNTAGFGPSADKQALHAALTGVQPGSTASDILQAVIDAAKLIWSDPHTQQLATQLLQQILAMLLASFGFRSTAPGQGEGEGQGQAPASQAVAPES